MKAISLFSSAGIDEVYLSDIGINIVASNELIKKRAEIHKWLFPNSEMITGDICDFEVQNKIKNVLINNNIDLLIATPPCQGMSIAGKNKDNDSMLDDERNHLIFKVIDIIENYDFKYILIENVPRFLKLKYKMKNNDKEQSIEEILISKFSDEYNIDCQILDCADYGVPQFRKRSIIRMYKKDLKWDLPAKEKNITVEEAIGHLPSLEAGEHSEIPYHYARNHLLEHVECMKHTPTGMTALDNKKYFPLKKNGEKVSGFKTCYKRIKWDSPSPTITIRSDAISSQNNVHPGRLKEDGTYSDARVLTIKELFILMSLPDDFKLPSYLSDTEIRQIIGEGIPPLLTKKILEGIK